MLPVLTTNEVTDITSRTAKSGGNITDDGGYSVTERGVVWGIKPNPTISDNKTSDGAGAGSFTSKLTSLSRATDYYVRAYATNINGTVYGTSFVFTTFGNPNDGHPCLGASTVTDIDGNVYNTVLIGNQCWMKENLKTTKYSNNTPIENPTNNSDWQSNTTGAYAWYENDISWKDSYGALYNWHAVKNYHGLCPTGWHIPTHDEWKQLIDYIVAYGFPNEKWNLTGTGNALKSCWQVNSPLGGDCNVTEHPRWDEDTYYGYDHYGFDEFGFSALPGGARSPNGGFGDVGNSGFWWSSTAGTVGARSQNMSGIRGHVSSSSNSYRSLGFSVRCLRNN